MSSLLAVMIGIEATLKDIVLTEEPEAVDLLCHEQLPPEEEELETRDPYRIAADCGLCHNRVRFICLADPVDILQFQQVLFKVSLVCLTCVKKQKLHHGG